jgi:ATP phosphoribosyltransferase regulatory subunit
MPPGPADHIADVLPSEARHIEELRRELPDTARGYGYELVMPPMLEHQSAAHGHGRGADLQTFKLVDQLSGRMLGLRADTTPQVARIDAHLLNRQGIARLCYCGPVLHTRPDRPHATREPLQFGAEIYGHAGLEADLEALQLALDCLKATKVESLAVDMADARIGAPLGCRPAPGAVRAALAAATPMSWPPTRDSRRPAAGAAGADRPHGDAGAGRGRPVLPRTPTIQQALEHLQWLSGHVEAARVPSLTRPTRSGYASTAAHAPGHLHAGASDALARRPP